MVLLTPLGSLGRLQSGAWHELVERTEAKASKCQAARESGEEHQKQLAEQLKSSELEVASLTVHTA